MEVADRNTAHRLSVLFYLYFPGGGIGRYTARLMPELSALGIDVEAAVVPEFQWPDANGFQSWPHLRSISHQKPWRRKARFLIGQFTNPRLLAKRVRETSPDVVHICNINHLSYPAWERLFPSNGPALAVSAHDVKRQKGILCKAWETRQLRRFYQRADLLFVHSQSQSVELVSFAGVQPDRIHVVPHGPYGYPPSTETKSETRQRLGIPANVKLGLAFGLVRDEKNYDQLIQALSGLPDEIHLLIAGSEVSGHQGIASYRSLANRCGVSKRVHFLTQFIPDEDVANLFLASDFLALTYKSSFTSQSGVLSSAVTFGLPIVATPTATFGETLENYRIGVLCKNDSSRAIRDAVEAICDEPLPQFDFCEYKNGNSWRQNARLTKAAYEYCLRSRG